MQTRNAQRHSAWYHNHTYTILIKILYFYTYKCCLFLDIQKAAVFRISTFFIYCLFHPIATYVYFTTFLECHTKCIIICFICCCSFILYTGYDIYMCLTHWVSPLFFFLLFGFTIKSLRN